MKKAIVLAVLVSGCATASPVMDLGDGTYTISAQAAPARGGATGATTYAYEKAQAFCAPNRPILVNAQERDIHQAAIGWNAYGGGGSAMAAGGTSIRFRCGKPSQ